jgi:hypothetical protein
MIFIAAPHTIDVDAYQSTYLNQRATSVALFGTAVSGNLALAPTSQTIFVVGS